ncbi:hypothetical protein [Streptomyces sp. LN590]|uniref:hypothetical protein n=1 Tax=unclassified Streptomyces TaxID=2593676 RepID=UPI00372324F6
MLSAQPGERGDRSSTRSTKGLHGRRQRTGPVTVGTDGHGEVGRTDPRAQQAGSPSGRPRR